jgi:hypothetical protein
MLGKMTTLMRVAIETHVEIASFWNSPQSCQGWGRGFESLRPLQISVRKSMA